MNHGCWHDNRLARHGIHRGHLHFIHVGVRVRHNNLDLSARLLHQNLKGLVIQPCVFLNAHALFVFPPKLCNAAFAHQRIFENCVSGQKSAVVILENVVCIVGCLLCRLDIFRPTGGKLHHILRIEENAHQTRQHGTHRVPYLHGHHLGVALDLVPKQVASVVFGSLGACWRQVAVHIADRIGQVLRDDALQFGIIHGCVGCNVCVDGVGDVLLVHGLTFVRMTYMESTALGVRRISSCGNFSACPTSERLISMCVILNRSGHPKYQCQSV